MLRSSLLPKVQAQVFFEPSDDNKGGASSASSENNGNANPDAAASTAPDADANKTAGSSGADEDAKKTLLEVVHDAVKEGEGASSTLAKKEGETAGAEGAKEGEVEPKKEGEVELTEAQKAQQVEDDKRLDKHPRFQQVIRQAQALKPLAEEYQKIQSFMTETGLTPKNVADGYQIMAALRNDPAKALEMLTPIMENLRKFAGDILPPDLQKKVDDGLLDEESARETAKLRHQTAFQGTQTAEQKEKTEREQEQARIVEQNRVMGNAITEWEAAKRVSDPDYAKKEALIDRFTKAALQEKGQPANPKEAVELMDGVYAEVNKHFKEFAPVKKPIEKGPGSEGSSSSVTKTPGSLLELVQTVAAQPA